MNKALRDVRAYPASLLQRHSDGVIVAASYRARWDDDYAVRGWKIDASIGDPEIIASTRETGERIPTSVFIHDLLDHLVSGFGISGHRSEAMALRQLALRTGSDPTPDYSQMIREDILQGRVNGESLHDFLPLALLTGMSPHAFSTARELIKHLREKLGDTALCEQLLLHFHALGTAGETHASHSWQQLGLDHDSCSSTGLCLQSLFEQADRQVEQDHLAQAAASIHISKRQCAFIIDGQQQYTARIN